MGKQRTSDNRCKRRVWHVSSDECGMSVHSAKHSQEKKQASETKQLHLFESRWPWHCRILRAIIRTQRGSRGYPPDQSIFFSQPTTSSNTREVTKVADYLICFCSERSKIVNRCTGAAYPSLYCPIYTYGSDTLSMQHTDSDVAHLHLSRDAQNTHHNASRRKLRYRDEGWARE